MSRPAERSFARTLTEHQRRSGEQVWRIERAPSGRALCRWCRTEVPKGRRTFCSEPCVEEWRIRNSQSYARKLVHKRDRGVCKQCSRDCDALAREIRAVRREAGWKEFVERLLAEGFAEHHVLNVQLWQMDHTLEVVNGGGACGLDNLTTLCIPCHKQKTRRLATERAAARRQSKGQSL